MGGERERRRERERGREREGGREREVGIHMQTEGNENLLIFSALVLGQSAMNEEHE